MCDHEVSGESIALAIGEFTASDQSSALVAERKNQCQWGFMIKSYGCERIGEKDVVTVGI